MKKKSVESFCFNNNYEIIALYYPEGCTKEIEPIRGCRVDLFKFSKFCKTDIPQLFHNHERKDIVNKLNSFLNQNKKPWLHFIYWWSKP